MLKLEKTSQRSAVTIRLRERKRFFEPRLLQALAIALILHCGALLLFHVTPFTFSSTFIFPPVQVQSDHASKSISVMTSLHPDENEELSPPPMMLIPALDWISFSPQSILAPSVTLDPHALQFIEERLWPKWHDDLSLKLEEPRIQLSISGDLAEYSLITHDPLLNQMHLISPSLSPVYVSYQVQMDETTGELFWYERVESSSVVTLNQLTEKILLNLRFTPPTSKEPVTGILNFVILEEQVK